MNVIRHHDHGVVVYGRVSISCINHYMDLCAHLLQESKSSLVIDPIIGQELEHVTVNGEPIRPLLVVCTVEGSDAWRDELGIKVKLDGGAQ